MITFFHFYSNTLYAYVLDDYVTVCIMMHNGRLWEAFKIKNGLFYDIGSNSLDHSPPPFDCDNLIYFNLVILPNFP